MTEFDHVVSSRSPSTESVKSAHVEVLDWYVRRVLT
jgi:hypothetical protein